MTEELDDDEPAREVVYVTEYGAAVPVGVELDTGRWMGRHCAIGFSLLWTVLCGLFAVNAGAATFSHVNETVQRLELAVEGAADGRAVEVLEPTAGHPLFSLTRGDWVKAGELRPGERLQTQSGPAQMVSLSATPGAQRVFNFEVEGEHEYLVGGLGVRSHNACTRKAPTAPDAPPTLEDSLARSPGQKMRDGEAAVKQQTGLEKNNTKYTDEAGKKRIPDFVEEIGPNGKPSKMVESKNVKSQGYSDQIKAYEKMATKTGDPDAKVEIRMRSENHPEGKTKVPQSLQDKFDNPNNPLTAVYSIDY